MTAIHGVLPCKKCGEPHDAYGADDSRQAPQWAKAKDGHYYTPVVDPERVLTRMLERGVVTNVQVIEALA